jgi:hypothetical protein
MFINSEELTYFQISEVLRLNPKTQFKITLTIEVCIEIYDHCNICSHLRVRYVGSIEYSVVLSGFYPTDCQIILFEVRVNYFSSNSDG